MNNDLNCNQLEAFGKCLYYYNDSLLPITENEDKGLFIRQAVDKLDKQINLFHYDLVLFPKMRSRECQYMMRYIYRFNQPRLYNYEDVLANPMDEKLCETIRKQNVLVIDDVTTSGSTLNEVLRTLRILNEDNEITIFSLIGRKDLMADSY
jgi:hypothetical protein